MSPRDALQQANALRVGVAVLRSHIATGRVEMPDLFRDPPEIIKHLALIEVMELARSTRSKRGTWRPTVGRAALRDGVNLLMPVGQASAASREWAAVHSPTVRPSSARKRRDNERMAA